LVLWFGNKIVAMYGQFLGPVTINIQLE